ncbi:hypothetical protein IHE45_06G048700 [Dioscorea alata]|uniref:Uncharacterized protein n=1 Tax=Dioscorea alata TaxID=55571 RepID=A0ACB7VXB1_DIOAL|nr:hypothetical protein IHE45_06G048700 [Dioscorea alata]
MEHKMHCRITWKIYPADELEKELHTKPGMETFQLLNDM